MWCENCKRQNLTRGDIALDMTTRRLLCRDCYAQLYPSAPPIEIVDFTAPAPPVVGPEIQYDISLNNREGFKARVSYGDLSFGFHAPIGTLQRWLG